MSLRKLLILREQGKEIVLGESVFVCVRERKKVSGSVDKGETVASKNERKEKQTK